MNKEINRLLNRGFGELINAFDYVKKLYGAEARIHDYKFRLEQIRIALQLKPLVTKEELDIFHNETEPKIDALKEKLEHNQISPGDYQEEYVRIVVEALEKFIHNSL